MGYGWCHIHLTSVRECFTQVQEINRFMKCLSHSNKTRYNYKRQGKKIGSHYLAKLLLICWSFRLGQWCWRKLPVCPHMCSQTGALFSSLVFLTHCYINAASIYHPPCIYTSYIYKHYVSFVNHVLLLLVDAMRNGTHMLNNSVNIRDNLISMLP